MYEKFLSSSKELSLDSSKVYILIEPYLLVIISKKKLLYSLRSATQAVC